MALLVKDIDCRQAVRLIGFHLKGNLACRDRRRLEADLTNCDACSAHLE